MQTPLWIKIIFFPITILAWFLNKSEESQSYNHHEIKIPVHKFSDNEILQDGIDIRHPDHRQRVLDNRRAKEPEVMQHNEDQLFQQAEAAIKRGSDKLNKRKGY